MSSGLGAHVGNAHYRGVGVRRVDELLCLGGLRIHGGLIGSSNSPLSGIGFWW